MLLSRDSLNLNMKKSVLIFLIFTLNHLYSFSQKISNIDEKKLVQKEDSLKRLCIKIVQGINASDRFSADSFFTKVLVRSLQIKNSFYYPFDSLKTISKLYAPDSSFKIFTWQMVINDNVVRQHGAIQMRTSDGSLKLFPLIDKSEVTTQMEDTIGNNKGWMGAVYYKIIQKKSGNQNNYTLLGYDEYNIRSNRKIIDVLTFANNEPVFGGPYFSFVEDTVAKSTKNRFVMEYKKSAGARLNYDSELDLILYEHLVSETNEPNKKWTLIGDGDYEGFKWKNGKWVHIEKVFHEVTPLNQEPVPRPLRDKTGNIDEKKLSN